MSMFVKIALFIAAIALFAVVVNSFSDPVGYVDFKKKSVLDMELQSHSDFDEVPDIFNKIPPIIKANVKDWRMYKSQKESPFLILVAKIVYNDGVELSLQGAADGAVAEAARSVGDSSPKYSITTMKVKGSEAKRVEYNGQKGIHKFYLTMIAMQKGQSLYQIQVIRQNDGNSDMVEKVVESIHIK